MIESRKIFALDEDGNKVEYEVIASFDNVLTDKKYYLCTDYSEDEEGNTNVFAFVSDENETLVPVQTLEELEMIQNFIEQLQEE